VRADRMDEELAQLMKKSGCVELIFGVESGDQDILNKVIDKSLKLEEVEKSAVICKKIGIKTKAFFVIGFPGEKIANMKKSMEFALELREKYSTRSDFLIAAPLIGTKLYKICQEKRYLTAELTPRNLAIATQSYGRGLIKTPDFTPEQLKDLANGLERKMAKIDFKEKLKNPVAYWQGLKFVFTHPKKTIKYLREKIFS
jgi:magnesium-protoporphyrin IX monomethyl ester (oxidative) cyclase